MGKNYTARQLSGITLLVTPFCLTTGENLCQCKALDNIQKTSQRHGAQLISSIFILEAERKLVCFMIQGRERSSFDVIVGNKCPRSPWVRLLRLRTRHRTF